MTWKPLVFEQATGKPPCPVVLGVEGYEEMRWDEMNRAEVHGLAWEALEGSGPKGNAHCASVRMRLAWALDRRHPAWVLPGKGRFWIAYICSGKSSDLGIRNQSAVKFSCEPGQFPSLTLSFPTAKMKTFI